MDDFLPAVTKPLTTYSTTSAPVTPARRIHRPAERQWQPMMIEGQRHPGFWIVPIVDDETGAWTSYWMRLDAGARSLLHTHTSTELLYITDGIYTDQDGTDIAAGEVVTFAAGSSHWSYSRDGCTVLVVTNSESSL
ncbi:cupin domain-containing protein [Paraburkholderia aromaticivorans]|uniref:cupin domain-containing protein n=1 Tax=Paraburkholderia aromaticivorans TaxID=2026199 RepID=UPI0038B8C2C3